MSRHRGSMARWVSHRASRQQLAPSWRPLREGACGRAAVSKLAQVIALTPVGRSPRFALFVLRTYVRDPHNSGL